MIILASAIIISLNQTDVLKKANDAVNKNNLQEIQNLAALAWAEAYLDKMKDPSVDLNDRVYQALYEHEITDEEINNKYVITVTDTGVEVQQKDYKIGQEVTITDTNGVAHVFYVIEDSATTTTTVKLLAKEKIDTTTLLQSTTGSEVTFTSEDYWPEITSYPHDFLEAGEPDERLLALKAAYDYGYNKFGVTTVRLMLRSEAEALLTEHRDILIHNSWLGYLLSHRSAMLYYVSNTLPDSLVSPGDCTVAKGYVRPVITIAKTVLF